MERHPGPALHAGEHRPQPREPAAPLAAQDRTQDLLNFNRWLELTTEGNTTSQRFYQRRFRHEFRPAFDAWLSADPLNNPDATPEPAAENRNTSSPTRRRPTASRSVGDQRFEQGKKATETADDYVFVTVFFAIVLFFAGISLRFAWLPIRVGILGLGAVLLISRSGADRDAAHR